MKAFRRFAVGVCLSLLANFPAHGEDRNSSDKPLYDIVAVGKSRREIILATLGSPPAELKWRLRRIPISPGEGAAFDISLSTSGTKALVTFSDGSLRVLDLTERIDQAGSAEAPAPQHRLPHERFPLLENGRVCWLDDLGQRDVNSCATAAAAGLSEDGSVLYADRDGRLTLSQRGSADPEELTYRIPASARYELLSASSGEATKFLLLVTKAAAGPDAAADSVTEIIDPRAPIKPLGRYKNPEVAALRALLDFSEEQQQRAGGPEDAYPSDQELEKLVANLHAQSGPPDVQWSFYRVKPEPELYAPVLEFADGEPDYPADTNVWNEIKPQSRDASLQDYRTTYASMGDRRWSRCTTYVRTISYPGTWLIEYWFYYPFDEGKAHPHLHDSEHFFVEVDKLGGTVRNVFASDHDSFVPNNLYSTLVKGAPPVSLPLFATVELGKHAMAPDMDRDGRFVRGIDDNMHPESYAFWGLRDRSTKFHFMMEPYMGSMSVPRNRAGRFALKDAALLFPNLDVPSEHLVCSIQPFPEDPPCPDCGATSAHAAATYLADHPDAIHPESIYKPYVLPWREVRFGVGLFDWTDNRGELSVAYAGDFRHITGGLLPIPARLALEYGWRPYSRSIAVPFGGHEQFVASTSTMYAGVRLERLITNTQGLYFAVSEKWGDISERFVNGALSPSAQHWQYGGISYHAGYVLELPSAHKGNMIHHVGALIGSVPGYPVLFEWRVSFAFFRQRGRHDFGARVRDRNPYDSTETGAAPN
jgi:hypothetical protein